MILKLLIVMRTGRKFGEAYISKGLTRPAVIKAQSIIIATKSIQTVGNGPVVCNNCIISISRKGHLYLTCSITTPVLRAMLDFLHTVGFTKVSLGIRE